jgi:hypothetical protein
MFVIDFPDRQFPSKTLKDNADILAFREFTTFVPSFLFHEMGGHGGLCFTKSNIFFGQSLSESLQSGNPMSARILMIFSKLSGFLMATLGSNQ